MQKFYLENALNIAKEMIHSYHIDFNVDGVFKNLNQENFTFLGFTENNFFDSVKKFRKYAENSLDWVRTYKVVDENYFVGGESVDGCLVVAKIKFLDTLTQNSFMLNYFFYFSLIGRRMLCSHYHVTRPVKIQTFEPLFFREGVHDTNFSGDVISHYEDLINLINSDAVAEKSFFFDVNFSYRSVNRNFIKLLGYEKINSYLEEKFFSSLEHIHDDDKNLYVEYLKAQVAKKITEKTSEYKYQGSYFFRYRLKSKFLAEGLKVLEWGNFFTQNETTMVNCFVLNLDEVENISLNNPPPLYQYSKFSDAELGVRINKNLIFFPRKRQIQTDCGTIDLTPIECEIFLVLIDKINQPMSVDEIYKNIWNDDELHLTSNTLPMHISNIRRKLRPCEKSIQLVFVKNEGYCLRIF